MKGALHQEEITIINLYASNVGTPNFIKHTLINLKTQIDPNRVIVRVYSTPLSPIDMSFRQKINKEILELNNIARGLRGIDNGGNVNNVQYKSNWNCHYESHLYNEYFLIKNL
jgi:hypothetical protein